MTGKMQAVGIDDAAAVLARFANGSLGTFESTRYARGHKALYTLEINGEQGLARLGPARPQPRAVFRPPRRGRRCAAGPTILVTDGDHPYLGKWWVPGLIIGYEHSLHPPGRRFPRGADNRQAGRADLPRRARDQPGLRRDHRFGQDRAWVDLAT